MSSELTRARGATLGTALLFVALQVPAAAVQDPLFTDLHLMHPVNRDATFAPALGDLDGDGDLDVYEGNQKQDRVLLFSPDRGFEELPGAVPENPFVNAVELADLDGDGDLDAFVVDNGENALLESPTGSGKSLALLCSGASSRDLGTPSLVFPLQPNRTPPSQRSPRPHPSPCERVSVRVARAVEARSR